MAEHIVSFSSLKDENIVKPKDKLDYIPKDNRIGKYRIHGRRFIVRSE
jgi:hypothetical protein